MSDWIQLIDQNSLTFLVWLQGFQSGGLTAVMRFLSYLGTEYFFLLLLPFLYWVVSKRWGVMVGLSLLFSSYLVGIFKWTFNIPRPPSPPVTHLWTETSPSFISGHATTAMAVWGTLASLVQRLWFWLIAGILIFGIGFSRLYLGVHYPLDVVAGWLMGALVAWAVLGLAPRFGRSLGAWPAAVALLGALGVSLLMILLHPGWPETKQWPAPNAIQLGGILFGMLSGLIWDSKALHFRVDGPWWQRLLRLLVGLLLVALCYLLPKWVVPSLDATPGLAVAVRFLRYALVGLTVSGLAPWLFKRLHLAD